MASNENIQQNVQKLYKILSDKLDQNGLKAAKYYVSTSRIISNSDLDNCHSFTDLCRCLSREKIIHPYDHSYIKKLFKHIGRSELWQRVEHFHNNTAIITGPTKEVQQARLFEVLERELKGECLAVFGRRLIERGRLPARLWGNADCLVLQLQLLIKNSFINLGDYTLLKTILRDVEGTEDVVERINDYEERIRRIGSEEYQLPEIDILPQHGPLVSDIKTNAASVTWTTLPWPMGVYVSSYEASITPSGTVDTPSFAGSAGMTEPKTTLSGLIPGTLYTVSVKVKCGNKMSAGKSKTFTTLPPNIDGP